MARKRIMKAMAESNRKSTATICLDGTDYYKILQSYVAGMKVLDDWLRDGEKVVDVSLFFGPGHDIVRTREGIFTMIFELEGNFLTVPIEGLNLYLRGFGNIHGNFEFNLRDPKTIQDKSYTYTVLDIGVNYHVILDNSLERTFTGVWPLKKAVRALCKYKGGPAAAIASHVGTIAIHISEAARTGPMHSYICRSLVDKNLSRLQKKEEQSAEEELSAEEKERKKLIIYIRKYSKLSFEVLHNIDRICRGDPPLPINHYGLDVTLRDLVVNMRVCYRESYTAGVFEIESSTSKKGTGAAKGGTRGIGGGQRLLPHNIQKRSFSTSTPECSYAVKCNLLTVKGPIPPNIPSYTVNCARSEMLPRNNKKRLFSTSSSECFHTVRHNSLPDKGCLLPNISSYAVNCARSQTYQEKTIQIVDSPRTFKRNPAIEKHHTLKTSSYSVRCDLSEIAQKENRTKPFHGVNCSLIERLSGQKGSIRKSSEGNHSCMFQNITQGTIFDSKAIHPNDWAHNRRPVSRMQCSRNLLLPNLPTSFPYQNVRWYLCRALRFWH